MPTPTPPGRGRPRRITDERIVDAGIEMTLPGITITGMAKHMGVNVGSLYKYVSGVAELQSLVAEGIISRWHMPEPTEEELGDYLLGFSHALRDLALTHPGIAEFFLRTTYRRTPETLKRINAHHLRVAARYGLEPAHTSIVLATVSEHTLAVTEVQRKLPANLRDYEAMSRREELQALSASAKLPLPRDADGRFDWSVRALVRGVLDLLREEYGEPGAARPALWHVGRRP